MKNRLKTLHFNGQAEKDTVIQIRLPAELREQFKKMAKQTHRSCNDWLIIAGVQAYNGMLDHSAWDSTGMTDYVVEKVVPLTDRELALDAKFKQAVLEAEKELGK